MAASRPPPREGDLLDRFGLSRAAYDYPQCPVIYQTPRREHAATPPIELSRIKLVDNYVTKPFDPKTIEEKIDKVLSAVQVRAIAPGYSWPQSKTI